MKKILVKTGLWIEVPATMSAEEIERRKQRLMNSLNNNPYTYNPKMIRRV